MFLRVKEDIRTAMIEKDIDRKNVLKQVVAKAQDFAKREKKSDAEIDNDTMMRAIRGELKQLEQTKTSIAGYENSDLYKSTEKKISLLEEYLPKGMTKEETGRKVEEILAGIENPNKGVCMKAAMAELRGLVDNKIISVCVDEFLSRR